MINNAKGNARVLRRYNNVYYGNVWAAAPGPPRQGAPLFLVEYGMNPVSSSVSKLAAEQARTIRAAQTAGRTVLPWSVSLSDGRIIIVYAATDRAARSVASSAGPAVLRVGPAVVRDLAGALGRALSACPAPRVAAPSVVAPVVSSRDALRDWLASGEGPRPVFSAGPLTPLRVKGEPRKALTARCRPFVDAPIVGAFTLSGGRSDARPVRLAHEARPARRYVPEWNPGLPLFSVA